ncbi:hypothetical protein RchiOBHm_Chr7g0224151 [Rosa chinensis]|uniref:Uncharacterized protein n=1 Tax=Rosa chinensis TaxID=74649 RepID=A0A2P6PDT1_ROSCH|nr:hypothetical protein RchiOBHm_Chr7g0224151 [Rosa chinensis]
MGCGLWGIIRSSYAMQSEISETVHSVHNKLANPEDNAEGQSSTHVVQVFKSSLVIMD